VNDLSKEVADLMMSSEGTRITPGDGDSKIKVIEELTNEGSANPSRC
jgi:hypothetical protein|tara:strand:+ start:701 stop:841 length:141 start_codon:yes stop_codon:yes gene_type:complete